MMSSSFPEEGSEEQVPSRTGERVLDEGVRSACLIPLLDNRFQTFTHLLIYPDHYPIALD